MKSQENTNKSFLGGEWGKTELLRKGKAKKKIKYIQENLVKSNEKATSSTK